MKCIKSLLIVVKILKNLWRFYDSLNDSTAEGILSILHKILYIFENHSSASVLTVEPALQIYQKTWQVNHWQCKLFLVSALFWHDPVWFDNERPTTNAAVELQSSSKYSSSMTRSCRALRTYRHLRLLLFLHSTRSINHLIITKLLSS